MRVIVEADGGSRGNPGPAGYGAVVRASDTGEVLAERAAGVGVSTNNVAEYGGLIAGLRAAGEIGADEVEARLDSKLVVEQLSGRWQVKQPHLVPLVAEARALAAGFADVRYVWVPRARNAAADALANRAMDGEIVDVTVRRPVAAVAPVAPVAPVAAAQPSTDPARLVLVRHGATAATAGRRYSGQGPASAGLQLSPIGELQVAALAARLMDLVPDTVAVITSPLTRARRTGEAIRAALGVDLVVDADLSECDFGDWDGLTAAEVRERWPRELDDWWASTAVAPPGGESLDAVAVRAGRALDRLRTRYLGASAVVVSHVTPIKSMLRLVLDAGPALLHRLLVDPAGITLLDAYPDGPYAVRCVNDTAHLSGRGTGGRAG
jgi:probable phosphoglycerate mutase